jgi:hypothetical protein
MMRRPKPDAPPEVQRDIQETTSRLKQHTVQGWYYELTRVHRLSVEHGLGLHTDDPRILVRNSAGETSIVHVGGPFASFTVNLNMPDALLNSEFDRWLEEGRKQVGSPVVKPGRGSSNGLFDETKFKDWRDTRIVEFADLLAWRPKLDPVERKNYPKSTLGEWIERYSPKDVNTTERVLKKALASLPALGAQAEWELIQTEQDREQIAARLARDIAREPVLVIQQITGNDT